ncbi:MAG: NAD-dependent epimerase/dehydratase family protein, partial [Deltaproteobacteria bacterium]|nr:NAD-dependent epimerase/dehydratase family protein [Deltaproteobacteria bacterium]
KKAKFYKLSLTETLADVRLSEIFKKEKVHTVVDTAIPTSPPKNMTLGHEIISVGTMYLCNASADAKIKKLILSSTTDVYGARPDNPNFLTEDHPTRGGIQNKYLADKIDAEKSALKLAKKHPEMTVTILRPCHVLGPTTQSYKTVYLARPFILTMMGYDPLMQFVHESDVIRAYNIAIEKDCPGIFNIVGKGLLPLSQVIRLLGKIPVPLPETLSRNLVQLLWYTDISPAPASYLNFLKYMCIADGEKAKREMNFEPELSSKQALLDFAGAIRLREVHLDEPEESQMLLRPY